MELKIHRKIVICFCNRKIFVILPNRHVNFWFLWIFDVLSKDLWFFFVIRVIFREMPQSSYVPHSWIFIGPLSCNKLSEREGESEIERSARRTERGSEKEKEREREREGKAWLQEACAAAKHTLSRGFRLLLFFSTSSSFSLALPRSPFFVPFSLSFSSVFFLVFFLLLLFFCFFNLFYFAFLFSPAPSFVQLSWTPSPKVPVRGWLASLAPCCVYHTIIQIRTVYRVFFVHIYIPFFVIIRICPWILSSRK